MAIDHDQIFKLLIEAFFREFLWLFCPIEAAQIDFQHVEFLREEIFTDVRRGRRKRLDLVAKVRLKRGGERYILVHFEFEASHKDQDFPRRMYEYFSLLFLRHGLPIVPIAVFSDASDWTVPVPDFFELTLSPKSRVRFDYHLIKLSQLDYRHFLESDNPLAFALMAKMKYTRRERVRLKADFLRLILRAGIDPARQSLLLEFVETYMPLVPTEQIQFIQLVQIDETYQEVKQMVTTYEKTGIKKGRKEGIKEGRKEGMEKGMEKGRLEALTLLLEKRFPMLPEDVRRKVERIHSRQRIDELLLAVLTAKSLSELGL
ncbi:MAG: Rpn family recombination-promoting nuclease/putative transposase [Planctomycetaceae bacterium]